MNFNSIDLMNSRSYIEQKINLTGDRKKDPLYEREIFLIPNFTVVCFPMKTLQKSSYYYIELQISEAYSYDFLSSDEESEGLLEDVTLQYDLNYSNINQASGQIVISRSIKWKFMRSLYFVLLENDKRDPYTNISYFYMFMKTYKIILPALAIKKDDVNILNYSFNCKKPSDLRQIRHINNKHNYGSLSFYFNTNPQYQLQIKPKMFNTTNFNLEIKNPLILTTHPSDGRTYHYFSKTIIKNLIIGGKSWLDEVFNFSGNNISAANIVPIKIKHYLVPHFPKVKFWYHYREKLLNKILVFNNNFNLQQNTTLNINENLSKFYQNNKIPALLLRDTNNSDEYYLEFFSMLYNDFENKITLNDEVVKNQFDLPKFESFHFNISVPFNFQTFFNYNINLKFTEESNEPIIGGPYHSISINKLIKDNSEKWLTTTNFSLTYTEILKFYSSNNFNFIDYKYLNHSQEEI